MTTTTTATTLTDKPKAIKRKRGRPPKHRPVEVQSEDENEDEPDIGSLDPELERKNVVIDELIERKRSGEKGVAWNLSGYELFNAAKEAFKEFPGANVIITMEEPIRAHKDILPLSSVEDYAHLVRIIQTRFWHGQRAMFKWVLTTHGRRSRATDTIILEEDPERLIEWERRRAAATSGTRMPSFERQEDMPMAQPFQQPQMQPQPQPFQQPQMQPQPFQQPQMQPQPQQWTMQQPAQPAFSPPTQWPYVPPPPMPPPRRKWDEEEEEEEEEEEDDRDIRRMKREISSLNNKLEQMTHNLMSQQQSFLQQLQQRPQQQQNPDWFGQYLQWQQQQQQQDMGLMAKFAQDMGMITAQLSNMQQQLAQRHQAQVTGIMPQQNPLIAPQQQQQLDFAEEMRKMLNTWQLIQRSAATMGLGPAQGLPQKDDPPLGIRVVETPGGRLGTDSDGKPLGALMQIALNFDKVEKVVDGSLKRLDEMRKANIDALKTQHDNTYGKHLEKSMEEMRHELMAQRSALLEIREKATPLLEQAALNFAGNGGTAEVSLPAMQPQATSLQDTFYPAQDPTQYGSSPDDSVPSDKPPTGGGILAGLNNARKMAD